MAEHQVTVGNTTHPLEPLFFVMATQNPIEVEGTYQLPAAQIDRFLMRLSLGYPDLESEYSIVKDDPSRRIMPHLEPVCTKDEILEAQVNVDEIYCTQELMETAVNIAAATREYPGVELGVSPRASIMLVTAARAYALVKGRTYVVDQDIVECAPLVFAHRLILNDTSLQSYTIIREIARENIAKLSQ
jgi:MoxR-like ATPase